MTRFYLQPGDDEGPVFHQPWEAQAFALVLALHERGLFNWAEWAAALHNAIHMAQLQGDPDLGDTYYTHWLLALEELLQTKHCTNTEEINRIQAQWHSAYIHTPHGQPVEIGKIS